MTLAYITKLGLTTWKTSIGVQKIDSLPIKTYNMVLASFLLMDSLGKIRFFEKTFLLANTSIEVVLGMPLLFLSNINIKFAKLGKITYSLYTAAKALPTNSWMKLINKKKLAKATIDKNCKTFIMYVSALDIVESLIYPF